MLVILYYNFVLVKSYHQTAAGAKKMNDNLRHGNRTRMGLLSVWLRRYTLNPKKLFCYYDECVLSNTYLSHEYFLRNFFPLARTFT